LFSDDGRNKKICKLILPTNIVGLVSLLILLQSTSDFSFLLLTFALEKADLKSALERTYLMISILESADLNRRSKKVLKRTLNLNFLILNTNREKI